MGALVLVLAMCFVAIAACLIRNEAVHALRRRVLSECGVLHQSEIHAGLGYTGWRYDRFDSVGYRQMVYSLRPLTVEEWWGAPVVLWQRDDSQRIAS